MKQDQETNTRTGNDRNVGTIFGHKTRSVSTCRKNENSLGVLFGSSRDSSNGDSFSRLSWSGLNSTQVIIQGRVADRGLSEQACLGHHQY